MKLKTFLVGLLCGFFFTAGVVYSGNYSFFNKKLHPTRQSRPTLTNTQLADAVFYNQERIDQVRVDMAQMRREMDSLRQDIKDIEDSFVRFRNYYFRKI